LAILKEAYAQLPKRHPNPNPKQDSPTVTRADLYLWTSLGHGYGMGASWLG